jgi:multiple antibiotic resistance protein
MSDQLMTSLLIAIKIIPMIFMALFPVVNPIGTALILFGMTRGVDDQTWKSMSRKIAFYSFLFLTFFFFFGGYILKLFGISIPVVQFSGGIVLALMGWEQGAAVVGIFMMCVVVSVCYRNLDYMTKRFSAAGTLALSKILAFFVLCIGVEIAWAGFKALGH